MGKGDHVRSDTYQYEQVITMIDQMRPTFQTHLENIVANAIQDAIRERIEKICRVPEKTYWDNTP
jgi:hypothetical protein